MVFTLNSNQNEEEYICTSKTAKSKVIVIAGSTASGKSKIAFDLAKRIDGIIINADSMQVYRDVATLTARPSPEEEKQVEHFLYGFLEPQESCNAYKWGELAAEEIKRGWERQKIPIIVGGSGFYIQTLLKGISPVPQAETEVRKKVKEEYDRLGHSAFLEKIRRNDDRFSYTDPQRLLRAAEVLEQTGRSICYWQSKPYRKVLDADFLCLLTHLPREELYRRCNERFRRMMDLGAVDEVRELLRKDPPEDSLILKAIGVAEIRKYLLSEMTLEEVMDQASRMTRNYAKRQLTWFRHKYTPDIIVQDLQSADILTKVLHFLS